MDTKVPTIADLFQAAKENNAEKLICLLGDKRVNWSSNLRKDMVDDLWVLETALLCGSKEAANILACYEILGWEYISNKKPDEIIATKSVWCRSLSNAVDAMKKIKRKKLREPVTSGSHIYLILSYPQTSAKNKFYDVVRNHYSLLLTPFDAIERPAAFMAMMRLDDNFRIISPGGLTLPMHILACNKVNKDYKRYMLDFIARFDKDVFQIPSGPEGLVPSVYCLKTNNVYLFDFVPRPDFTQFRSKDGKSIMGYCTNKHFEKIWGKDRQKIFEEVDEALNTFLMRNMTAREAVRYYCAEALEALATVVHTEKRVQLQEFADKVKGREIAAYMAQLGYQSENLEKHKCIQVSNTEKKYFAEGAQTKFEFENLPSEILEMIMTSLSVQDIMHLFMVSKYMHQSFAGFDSNALWRLVLKNSKISLEGDIPMTTEHSKKYAFEYERIKKNWRRGKFQEKSLFTISDYVKDCPINDNWLCAVGGGSVHWYNFHTQKVSGMVMINCYSHCFIEAPPLDAPLVAMLERHGEVSYGRVSGAYPSLNKMRVSHAYFPYNSVIHALSSNRVIISGGPDVQVIDLNSKSVILKTHTLMGEVMPNPFNRSIMVASSWNEVKIFDENILAVQSMDGLNSIMKNFGMIDEHSLALGTSDRQIRLYDIRKLDPQNYTVLLNDVNSHSVSMDIRNQRMLAEVGSYKVAVQMDLKTREWERIWTPFENRYYRTYPLINDKYMVFRTAAGLNTATIFAYDFSV